MKFTVLWTPSAERDLAEAWITAEDRGAITSAAATIDTLLRSNPHAQGESREGSLRIAFIAPLGIDFEILEDDRIVYVLAAWTIAKRNR